jgi:hypothetical protein
MRVGCGMWEKAERAVVLSVLGGIQGVVKAEEQC